jgi:nucleotide-binding universal stress UspA family protein
MKKIVVAVDFSSGSLHALDYAIGIANQSKSDIIMIWVDKTASPESIYASMVENYRGEVVKRFNDLVAEVQPKLTGGKIDYKLRKGRIYAEIVNFAKLKKADCIITGSHGVSGFEEYWIGSNANRIVGHAKCPVITVRNGYNIPQKISRIVVPIDHSNHTLSKIPFTTYLARIFGAEVHLLVIFSTNLQTMHKRVENFAEKAKKYFDKAGVTYQVETNQTQNATKATIEYAKSINAELISIMTEQDERRDSGLLGPCAQQVVNHSPIPVLSVHVDDDHQPSIEMEQI